MERTSSADARDLLKLYEGEIDHIHLEAVDTLDNSAIVSKAVLESGLIQDYLTAPGLKRLGMAYTEARETDLEDEYFGKAEAFQDTISMLLGAARNPFDLMMSEIGRRWEGGVKIADIQGKGFAPGILRFHQEGWVGVDTHIDDPRQAILQSLEGRNFVQISVVYYCEVPVSGGELHLWGGKSWTKESYKAVRKAFNVPKLTDAELGAPSVSIKPGCGDIVIFRTDRPHRVSSVTKGNRLTFAFFGAMLAPGEPVRIWA